MQRHTVISEIGSDMYRARYVVHPTAEEVVLAVGAADRPLCVVDIARCILAYHHRTGTDPWGQGGFATRALSALLDRLAADGTLLCLTGAQWRKRGRRWDYQRRNVRYWTTAR